MEQRDLVAFAVFCGDWAVDVGETAEYWERWKTYWMPELEEEHFGDCTKAPCSCSRCLVEGWYELADDILRSQTKARRLQLEGIR